MPSDKVILETLETPGRRRSAISFVAKVFRRLSRAAENFEVLGSSFFLRYLVKSFGPAVTNVEIKNVGPMRVRWRDSDPAIIRQIFVDKVYDISAAAQFDRIMLTYRDIKSRGRIPLILDAGANIGASAIWFSRQFPDAKIIAIEPEPNNAEICRYNFQSFPNCMLVEGAIGFQSGIVAISNIEGTAVAPRTERINDGVGVSIYSIQMLNGMICNSEILIVKVDIEGFEDDLFSANTDWVKSTAAIFIEPHDWMLKDKKSSRSFRKVMFELDFDLLIQGENLVFVNTGDRF
jgi:FkbM family methyltransferase